MSRFWAAVLFLFGVAMVSVGAFNLGRAYERSRRAEHPAGPVLKDKAR